ncbi:hypothetical protein M153_8410003953 [Pseudoloma neurophilia]|uniref:Uncharacterized protein n=1 Tax=Pseudoloma neurophilia TaxID=146866 RepID=A0A0R0M243_9MICR|nr:hypothetical protein M153_8410003953 [Pseudoloma neurophilia]
MKKSFPGIPKTAITGNTGVNGEKEQGVRELIDKLDVLGLSMMETKLYKSYPGRGDISINRYLEQFDEFSKGKEISVLIKTLRNSSDGNFYNWLSGIENEDYETWEELKVEIVDLFGTEDEKNSLQEWMSVLNKGFRPGKIENDICLLFSKKQKASMSIGEILSFGARTLMAEYASELETAKSWSDAIKIGRKLDMNFERNRLLRLEIKKRNDIKGNHGSKWQYNRAKQNEVKIGGQKEQIVPKHITCYNCKGNHYRSSCPKLREVKLIKNSELKTDVERNDKNLLILKISLSKK